MTLRTALSILTLTLLAGCVSGGAGDPLASRQGRADAGRAYVQLGLGYLQQGLTGQAKAPLIKALALDGNDADAHAALALVFQAEGEPALAETHFRKALSARPSDTRIRNNYGSFLYAQGQFRQAQQMFRQAAADTLYPERSRVYENLGLVALKLERRDQAREYLGKALQLDPRQPKALLEMAELSYENRHYVPARDYYDRFSQLSDANARSLLLGSRLARALDEPGTVAELGQQLQRLYPGTPEYQQYLSEQR
ncbi:type IV pilus biogenesis/stability protein PilW [Pseudomonas guariconensis]|uniref:type IV pilus biogenesis/stability protein PilW n=1 Tax=Pseudomonas guariconensis TaxID=1288410 RepID=UPI0018AB39B4|nr:type IV pilus biogenesis/stability protein PilW [Pseudomonas guariconensis]MBF8720659.1 type IV pilus biogenesis/stability protein PilW [Pseudomonas guariconensis]MBF8743497.1 type IV pilus biogenesis/stability protein PilW [Pseudomonas guariconensis]MBF8749245.1 type IV pilus biogenesis/stability protein PilW [Pseudomonas guariconensis]MBF8792114.1 type IV pilus biogenesis/stability protein PilW [Pseudomonas monteilii]